MLFRSAGFADALAALKGPASGGGAAADTWPPLSGDSGSTKQLQERLDKAKLQKQVEEAEAAAAVQRRRQQAEDEQRREQRRQQQTTIEQDPD